MMRIGLILLVGLSVAQGLPEPTSSQQSRAALSLIQAMQDYKDGKHEEVERTCDFVIRLLTAPGSGALNREQRLQLATAYEVRARARFAKSGNEPVNEAIRQDLRSILEVDASYKLGVTTSDMGGGAVHRDIEEAFDAERALNVGSILLSVTPAGAEVRVDDILVDLASQPVELTLFAKPHAVTAKLRGFRDLDKSFVVEPGKLLRWPLELERSSSTLSITTDPAGVDVVIDGTVSGTTVTGPSGGTIGVATIFEVRSGPHEIEFRKDCYISVPVHRTIPQPAEITLPIVKLDRADAPLTVEGVPGTLVIDGTKYSETPRTICEGPHLVEVRTDHSRSIHRIEVKAGEPQIIRSTPLPAIAILSANGLPDGYRDDLRIEVETALRTSTGVLLFAPSMADARAEMQRVPVESGWLAFDTLKKPIPTYQSVNMSSIRRGEYSKALSGRLAVQGLAEITVPSQADPSNILLTVIPAGSSDFEVLTLNLNSRDSIQDAFRRLSAPPRLFVHSIGVQTADVRDVGVVVVRQLWTLPDTPSLQPGDVILDVQGQPVNSSADLMARIAGSTAEATVQLQVRDRDGVTKPTSVLVLATPDVIGLDDVTLLVTKAILDFRAALHEAVSQDWEAVAHLNLGVAHMKFSRWVDAKDELEKAKATLPNVHGFQSGPVSSGTLAYLLGVCLEGMGRRDEADAAFDDAAKSKDRLTWDGPLISELAKAKLDRRR